MSADPPQGKPPGTRTYRKRKRARQEAETRRRITEAVVELHRTVGPASTTVTDVAALAGVSRMTVYNHFPTDADLVEACSTHWSARNPPPAPSAWAGIEHAPDRLVAALGALYRWYRGTQDMMGKILRDAPVVEPLGALMDNRWRPYLEEVVRGLVPGWPEGATDAGAAVALEAGARAALEAGSPGALEAALRVAVDFHTWQLLAGSGLADERAAELGARMVAGAMRARGTRG